MGDIMRQVGVRVDAKAIAHGLLEMMREESEDNEVLIRFGMLPAKWMELVERQMDSVIRERYSLLPKEQDRKDEHTVLINPGDPELSHVETFRVSRLVAEMVHEVCLALYGSVEMVV